MSYYDNLHKLPDPLVYQKVWRGENLLKRLWWWVVGMPPADELRERYSTRVFSEKEESRIREITREEL